MLGTQIKRLLRSESFLSLTDSSTTYCTLKSHKVSKDMVERVHVTPVVQPSFYEATRILYLHNKTKNLNYLNYFMSLLTSEL